MRQTRTYIHQLSGWPGKLAWDSEEVGDFLGAVRHSQGVLRGRMESLGFPEQQRANLDVLAQDVSKSSEIEGEKLDVEQVRSSLAGRLGIDVGGLRQVDRSVDGIVEMILDATQRYDQPLTELRLYRWHRSLFPIGYNKTHKVQVGVWRDDESGPMRVVSGQQRQETIHFEAPAASRIQEEMEEFLRWFNETHRLDPVLKAALAHLWFVTIHPFEDGNGRIARAIADMALARAGEQLIAVLQYVRRYSEPAENVLRYFGANANRRLEHHFLDAMVFGVLGHSDSGSGGDPKAGSRKSAFLESS